VIEGEGERSKRRRNETSLIWFLIEREVCGILNEECVNRETHRHNTSTLGTTNKNWIHVN